MRRTTWTLFGGLLLASCAMGPDYHGPPSEEQAAPAKFKNASASKDWKVAKPADDEAGGRWWTIFHDSTLDRLIDQSLAHNQDLRQAAARIAEARSQARVAAADLYPQVTLNPLAQRQRLTNTGPIQKAKLVGANPFASAAPATGAGATTGVAAGGSTTGASSSSSSSSSADTVLATQPVTTTYDLFRAPLNAVWEVDLFGRIRRSYEAARMQAQASEADFRNMALIVSANVAVDYFSIRSLDAEISVLERTIATRREAVRLADERQKAGLTNELDVTRARSDLATNEANLYAVRRTRGQVEDALATLLGEPASELKLPARPLKAGDNPPSVPPGLPSALLERRPDVASAERQLAASNARIGVATAAFFPQISLSAMAGFESADITKLFRWESRAWTVGGSLVQPIFEGGRNVANLASARAAYEESVAAYRGQVLKAFQEVEDSLNDLRFLASQADAQNRAVTAARRALELSQQQYEHGSITFLEVLDAERTLLADERVSAQLLGQRLQATVQLIKALGGAWH